MNKKIFISYKRKDIELVLPIVEKIKVSYGDVCWIDLEGIETQSQFRGRICEAIENSELVLFMYSKTHLSIDLEDDWTVKELDYAKKRKKVVLVNLDRTGLYGVFDFEFGSKNNIDATDLSQIDRLLKELEDGTLLKLNSLSDPKKNVIQQEQMRIEKLPLKMIVKSVEEVHDDKYEEIKYLGGKSFSIYDLESRHKASKLEVRIISGTVRKGDEFCVTYPFNSMQFRTKAILIQRYYNDDLESASAGSEKEYTITFDCPDTFWMEKCEISKVGEAKIDDNAIRSLPVKLCFLGKWACETGVSSYVRVDLIQGTLKVGDKVSFEDSYGSIKGEIQYISGDKQFVSPLETGEDRSVEFVVDIPASRITGGFDIAEINGHPCR